MKTISLVISCLFLYLAVLAQPSPASFSVVNDTIIARFNRGDYKAIFAMAGSYYRGVNSERELAGTLSNLSIKTGKITGSALVQDLGKVKHFTWQGEKASMNMELWLNETGVVRFKFNTFLAAAGTNQKKIPTDNPLQDAVDSAVHLYALAYINDPAAVGLSIGIWHAGKKYQYHYGEVEKGSGKLPLANTIFSMGSVTKPMVGMLLADAVLEHKLELQDDIRKYLGGDFPNLAWQGHPVRLMDLMHHTSGYNRFRINVFPDNYESMTPAEQLQYFDRYDKDSLLRDIHRMKIDTLPGAVYHYSIAGMILTGMALEKIYHQPLDKILRSYYSKHFYINETKLLSDPDDIQRYAKGYNSKGELMPPMPEYTPSLYTVKTTMNDMLNFLEAHVLEKDPAIQLAHRTGWGDPKVFSIGIGWQVTDDYGYGRWIKHSGFDYGSISLFSVHPVEKTGIMLWANDDGRQSSLFDLERNIKDHLDFIWVGQ